MWPLLDRSSPGVLANSSLEKSKKHFVFLIAMEILIQPTPKNSKVTKPFEASLVCYPTPCCFARQISRDDTNTSAHLTLLNIHSSFRSTNHSRRHQHFHSPRFARQPVGNCYPLYFFGVESLSPENKIHTSQSIMNTHKLTGFVIHSRFECASWLVISCSTHRFARPYTWYDNNAPPPRFIRQYTRRDEDEAETNTKHQTNLWWRVYLAGHR